MFALALVAYAMIPRFTAVAYPLHLQQGCWITVSLFSNGGAVQGSVWSGPRFEGDDFAPSRVEFVWKDGHLSLSHNRIFTDDSPRNQESQSGDLRVDHLPKLETWQFRLVKAGVSLGYGIHSDISDGPRHYTQFALYKENGHTFSLKSLVLNWNSKWAIEDAGCMNGKGNIAASGLVESQPALFILRSRT